MLMPKKVKFRKQHRGRRAGMAKGGVARSRADCVAAAMIREFTDSEINDPKFMVHVPNVRPRLQRIGFSCRNA